MKRPELISISEGNRKMGGIPSVSLPPIKSCPDWVPCKKDCYVTHNMARYCRNAIKSYDRNFDIYHMDPEFYFAQIKHYCAVNKVPYFRYHVSGDIPEQSYWDNMVKTANAVPGTRFMVLTKAYDTEFGELPENLSVMISGWPGFPIPKKLDRFPKIWMQDGTEDRIPKDALLCSGKCDDCHACWDAKYKGKDIYIPKH